MNCMRVMVLWLAILGMPTVAQALDLDRAEQLFAQHCSVCHGADRGGYIAPALNRDETKLSRAVVEQKIVGGVPPTLMPAHPSAWRGGLSAKDRELLVALVTTQPKRNLGWNIHEVRKSLEVFVADESRLPPAPGYAIDHIDDLMAVMSRGRQAVGDEAKVLFYDGRTHRKVGEVATDYAPHLMDFHPTQPRWAYVRDDVGYVHKIDLYSMKVVRKVRAGLNGTSLAVSRDGRYVAAGSYVPRTMVILDADTLEPVRLLELAGVDPDGKKVTADAGIITATPFANVFVVALEQAGQVWIVDLDKPGIPVTAITDVGRHLHDGFLSPDGRYLVVSSYDDHLNAVIDLARSAHRAQDPGRLPTASGLGRGGAIEGPPGRHRHQYRRGGLQVLRSHRLRHGQLRGDQAHSRHRPDRIAGGASGGALHHRRHRRHRPECEQAPVHRQGQARGGAHARSRGHAGAFTFSRVHRAWRLLLRQRTLPG
jgi:nitrite reductase (NO-forming)/hydroxylamine reductase